MAHRLRLFPLCYVILSLERHGTSFYILDRKPTTDPTDRSENTAKVTPCEPKHLLGLLTEEWLRGTYGSRDELKAATSLRAHGGVAHDLKRWDPRALCLTFRQLDNSLGHLKALAAYTTLGRDGRRASGPFPELLGTSELFIS